MPSLNLLDNSRLALYKSSITNAIETYPIEWKVILEPLQNSIDAINENPDSRQGVIGITFDLDSNEVSIRDNGTGFAYDPQLFYLSGGTKAGNPRSKGKIGVGLKVTIFSTRNFRLESVYADDETRRVWSAEVNDAYRYSDAGSLDLNHSDPSQTDRETGTTLWYSFPDDSVKKFVFGVAKRMEDIPEGIERSLARRFEKSFEHFFRTNGYAADVLRLLNPDQIKKIEINVTIKWTRPPNDSPEDVRNVFSNSNGRVSLSFENKYWDMEEVIATQRGRNRPAVVSEEFYVRSSSVFYHRGTVIWMKKFLDREDIKNLLQRRERETFNGLLEHVNGMYLALSTVQNVRNFFFDDPLRFISINGVPSDHQLPNPTRNALYANYPFCILDVDSTFNYGKLQTTNRSLVHQCGEFYLAVYRNAIIKIGEKIIGREEEAATSTQRVEGSVVITGLPDLGVPCSFVKEPEEELGLIGIFFDLLGRGVIRDYEFYSLNSKLKYDAQAMIKTPRMRSMPKATNDDQLKDVEFKLHLSELVTEFEEGKKALRDLSLIVVWDDDYSRTSGANADYEVISIEDSREEAPFNGVSKCLYYRSGDIECQLLVMKEFIQSSQQNPSR